MAAVVAADGTWYQRIDPDLGWVTVPGARSRSPCANRAGLRAEREYAPAPPPGVVRIAAFGDSFVHGDEVTTDEAWPTRLERLQPGLEVLNYGVGGYGIDQAMLRFFREGARFAPHVVLVGVITDDVLRGVNVFRPFFAPTTGNVLTKPRFLLDDDGTLRLLPNPLRSGRRLPLVPRRSGARRCARSCRTITTRRRRATRARSTSSRRCGSSSCCARPWPAPATAAARSGTACSTSTPSPGGWRWRRCASSWHASGRRGAEPLVVFFPDRTELDAHHDGRPSTYQPLLDRLAAEGVPVTDVLAGFDRLRPGLDHAAGSCAAATTRRTATAWSPSILRDELVARGLVPPASR